MKRIDPIKIVGTLQCGYAQAHEAGCIQAEGTDKGWMVMFRGLMVATGNNPCAECPKIESRATKVETIRCECFHQYHSMAIHRRTIQLKSLEDATKPKGTADYPGLSIKQIAEHLGISKNEVRRRKQAGTI